MPLYIVPPVDVIGRLRRRAEEERQRALRAEYGLGAPNYRLLNRGDAEALTTIAYASRALAAKFDERADRLAAFNATNAERLAGRALPRRQAVAA